MWKARNCWPQPVHAGHTHSHSRTKIWIFCVRSLNSSKTKKKTKRKFSCHWRSVCDSGADCRESFSHSAIRSLRLLFIRDIYTQLSSGAIGFVRGVNSIEKFSFWVGCQFFWSEKSRYVLKSLQIRWFVRFINGQGEAIYFLFFFLLFLLFFN